MQAYTVFLNGKNIDTVFYGNNVDTNADDVKRDLIDHDGYDPRIVVHHERMISTEEKY